MRNSHDLNIKKPESHNQEKITIIDDSVIRDKTLVQDPVLLVLIFSLTSMEY